MGALAELIAGGPNTPPAAEAALRLLDAWPASWPLALAWAGGPRSHSRWTIICSPEQVRVWHQATPDDDTPLREFAAAIDPASSQAGVARDVKAADDDRPPFIGGWIGGVTYEAACAAEPAMLARREKDDAGLARPCGGAPTPPTPSTTADGPAPCWRAAGGRWLSTPPAADGG